MIWILEFKPLEVRKHQSDYISQFKDKSVTVMLSSGVDSHSILFSCLDVGIKPIISSFTLDNHESRDFLSAQHTAINLNLKFRPVYLSTNLDELKQYILDITSEGVSGKTNIECIWAYQKLFDRVEEDIVLSDYGVDSGFALSKEGSIHHRDDVSGYALNKVDTYFKPLSQLQRLRKYAKSLGFEYHSPWLQDNIINQYKETCYTFDDLNKPKEKNPIREQYKKEFQGCKIYNHTNYQLGDSGIAKLFSKLVQDPKWNKYKYKSVVGIYNSVIRGEITTV